MARGREEGRAALHRRSDRAARFAARLVLGLVALAALVVGAGLVALRTPWGRRVLIERAERAVGTLVAGGARAGDIRLGADGTLELRDVTVNDAEGAEAIHADRLRLRLMLPALLRKLVRADAVEVHGLRVRARRLRDGAWNLAELRAPAAKGTETLPRVPTAKESGWRVEVDEVAVEGRILVEDLESVPGPVARAGRVAEGEVRLRGSVAWRAGRLSVELERVSLALRRPVPIEARLEGRLLVEEEVRVEALVVQAEVRGEALAAITAPLRIAGPVALRLDGGMAARRARARLSLRIAGGEVRGEASADRAPQAPWRWRAVSAVDALDPARITLHLRGLTDEESQRVAVRRQGRIDASLSANGRGSEYALALENLALRLPAARLSARGRLDGRGAIDLLVAADASHIEAATAALPLPRGSRPAFLASRGEAHVRAHLQRAARGPLAVDGTVTTRGFRLGTVHAARLDGAAHLVGLSGRASLRGERLSIEDREIDALGLDLVGDRRTVRLSARARGPRLALALAASGRPRGDGRGLDGQIDSLALTVERSGWRSVRPAGLSIAPSRVAVSGLSLGRGAERLSIDGSWRGGSRPALMARIGAQRIDLVDLARAVRPELVARLPAGLAPLLLDGELVVEGAPSSPRARLDAVLSSAGPRAKGGRLAMALRYGPDQAVVETALSLRGTPLLRVDAVLDGAMSPAALATRSAGALDGLTVRAEASIAGFDLARLRELQSGMIDPREAGSAAGSVNLDGLGGHLSARATAEGALREPSLTFEAALDGGRVGGLRVDRAEARGRGAHGLYHAELRVPAGSGAAASGALSLAADYRASDGALRGSLDAHRFALGTLRAAPGPLLLSAGALDAHLIVSGTASRPLLSGDLAVDGGAFALRAEGHRYTGVTLRASLAPEPGAALPTTLLTLQRVEVHSGDGAAQGSGTIRLDGLRPSSLDLRVIARRFGLTLGGTVVTRVDGVLHATGQARGGALVGHVVVEEGGVQLPAITSGRTLQAVGPLEDVVFVDAAGRRLAQRERAASSPLPLLVDVTAPGGIEVTGPDVSTGVRGGVHLVARGASFTLDGVLSADGGWVELVDKRFHVDHARLSFGGREPIDPDVDVRLTRLIGDVTVAVDVTGTARRPRIALSSDPPRYDDTELLALVLSGDPSSGAVDAASLDRTVVGALSGLIARRLKANLLPGLPIDVLRVEVGTTPTALSSVQATRVEVGKYVTSRVYVSYVHQFFSSPQTLERINSNQATVEWRFARRFELDTTYGDAGVGGLDFAFRYRF